MREGDEVIGGMEYSRGRVESQYSDKPERVSWGGQGKGL